MHSNSHPVPGTYDARRAERQARALAARRRDRYIADQIRATFAARHGIPAAIAADLVTL